MDEVKIKQLVNKYVDMGNEIFGRDLAYPTVAFDAKGSKAGTAWAFFNRVSFNMDIARAYPKEFERTVAHEVAHLFCNLVYPRAKQHHGREFKSIMQRLGHIPNTYHNYDVVGLGLKKKQKRYAVKCSCRTLEVTKTKLNKLHLYHCKICKSKLQYIQDGKQ